MHSVLLLMDEHNRMYVEHRLKDEGYNVTTLERYPLLAHEVLASIANHEPDVFMIEPGKCNPANRVYMEKVRRLTGELPLVLCSLDLDWHLFSQPYLGKGLAVTTHWNRPLARSFTPHINEAITGLMAEEFVPAG